MIALRGKRTGGAASTGVVERVGWLNAAVPSDICLREFLCHRLQDKAIHPMLVL